MIERTKPRSKPKVLTEEEKLAKEKERIRKLQQTRMETDAGLHYRPMEVGLENHDPLLEILRKEHPEKDPAKTKS